MSDKEKKRNFFIATGTRRGKKMQAVKSVLIALVAALLFVVGVSAADNTTNATAVTIAMSSTTATGLVIGVALIGVLWFGLGMMQGIQISDTITDAATETN